MMKVLTAKHPLQGFELKVAQHLAGLNIEGYALINFHYTNPINANFFEIDAVLIYEPGIVCCLEIKGYSGVWTGKLNGTWKSDHKEIKSCHGKNPFKQINIYCFEVLKPRLDITPIYVNLIIVAPDEATIKIDGLPVDPIGIKGSQVSICHLKELEKLLKSLAGAPVKLDFKGIIFKLTGSQIENIITQNIQIEPLENIPNTSIPVHKGDEVPVLDFRQEYSAKNIRSGHRIIYGVAGSGKTLMLIARAKWLSEKHPEYKILILCYNICLASYIKDALKGFENIKVFYFHEWAYSILTEGYLSIRNQLRQQLIKESNSSPTNSEIDEKSNEYLGQKLLVKLQQFDSESKWDALLIDEAQTFERSWFECCVKALKDPENGDLTIFGDTNQKMGKKANFTWKDVGIKAQGRSHSKEFFLDHNYRNTQQTLSAAWDILEPVKEEIDYKSTVSIREGYYPKLFMAESLEKEEAAIIKQIKSLQKAGYESKDIALIYRYIKAPERQILNSIIKQLDQLGLGSYWVTKNQDSKKNYNSKLPGVRIITTLSSLGLQFKAVLIIWVQQFDDCCSEDNDKATLARKQLYVSMTRTQDLLYLFGSGDSLLLSELEKSQAFEKISVV